MTTKECYEKMGSNYEKVLGRFRAAHTLKGVCVNLGFDKLYEASSKITEQLRAGKLEGCDEMFKDVEKEYEMTISVLKEFAEQN